MLDWGGVLTTPVRDALAGWAASEQLPIEHVRDAFAGWLGPGGSDGDTPNPVHLIERGELAVDHFERYLADALTSDDRHQLEPVGLLDRMFAHFTASASMTSLVWRARAAGLRTALLSNSWGNSYPLHTWEGMFDVVVISGEVGMRKPDAEIYHHTCRELGLATHEVVFVDDLAANVEAAAGVGMIAVRHSSYEQTVADLSALIGRDLSGEESVG